jgi:hypothetical protein
MANDFICPCCGYHSEYSEPFARRITDITTRYYGVEASDVYYNKSTHGEHNRARNLAIYFIRAMSGTGFKEIAQFFHWPANSPKAGEKYAQVVRLIAENKQYRREFFDVQDLILDALKEKINPHAISA